MKYRGRILQAKHTFKNKPPPYFDSKLVWKVGGLFFGRYSMCQALTATTLVQLSLGFSMIGLAKAVLAIPLPPPMIY